MEGTWIVGVEFHIDDMARERTGRGQLWPEQVRAKFNIVMRGVPRCLNCYGRKLK
jgi:hypothetical protein